MLVLLVGTGIFLTFGLKWMTVRKIGYAFKLLFQGRDKTKQEGEGEITPFQALMTALSATIGTGNIAGVATAIFLGGPGAVFWMWITALFGMATKYGEAVLAVKYREVKPNGSYAGGPMYLLRMALATTGNGLPGSLLSSEQ
jgi:AGCS family alanine or glycine:cation symporter